MYAIANDTSFYLPLAETVEPTWAVRHARLQQLAKGKGATDLEELELLRELEIDKIWLRVGEPGMGAYVERVLGYDPKTGQERMRVARALRELPEIARALGTGELSYSAVKELTRVATAETERRWLADSLGKRLREVETMISGRERGDLPETPPKLETIERVLHAKVSPSTFAKGREARKKLEEQLGHAIDEDIFFSMAFDAVLDGPGSTPDRARYQHALTTCDTCKRGWQHGGGRAIELSQEQIELAECDAERIGRLDAKTPTRASQDISPATRRFVLHRDGSRCQVPGCRSSRNLDLHHVVHRSKGGTSEPANLVTICAAHHQAHHERKLTIERQPNGDLRFEHVEPFARASVSPDVVAKVIDALIGMGFRKHGARSLVDAAIAHVGDPSPSALLREALRRSPSK